MFSLKNTLLIFLITFALLACKATHFKAPTIESSTNAKTSFEDFTKGTVVFPEGIVPSLFVYDSVLMSLDQDRPIAAALNLLEVMPSGNLTWFYLGKSAEKLGLYEPASIYYEKAKDEPWYSALCVSFQKSKFPTYCGDYDPDKKIKELKGKKNNPSSKLTDVEHFEEEVEYANYRIKQDKETFAKRHKEFEVNQNRYRSTSTGEDFTMWDIFTGLLAISAIAISIDGMDYQTTANTINALSQVHISNNVRSTPVQSTVGECSSDYQCSQGFKCVKPPLSGKGLCASVVNRYGIKEYYQPDPSSVRFNSNTSGSCRFKTDCPTSFTCDLKLKVCVKE